MARRKISSSGVAAAYIIKGLGFRGGIGDIEGLGLCDKRMKKELQTGFP